MIPGHRASVGTEGMCRSRLHKIVPDYIFYLLTSSQSKSLSKTYMSCSISFKV